MFPVPGQPRVNKVKQHDISELCISHTNGRKDLLNRESASHESSMQMGNRRKDDGCAERKVTAARWRLVCEGDKLTSLAKGNVNKKKRKDRGLQADVWLYGSDGLGSLLTLKTSDMM